MFIHYIFIFLAFLIDSAIATIFPVSFTMDTMYFVSAFGFSSLVLTIRKMNFTDSMLLSILSGMFYDFFFADTFMLYTIVFAIVCIIVKSWTKHVGDSLVENIIIAMTAIFVMQFIVYGYMVVFHQTTITFASWIQNRMFLTLLVNAFLVIILYIFINIRDGYIQRKELKIRKDEKIFLYRNRSSED